MRNTKDKIRHGKSTSILRIRFSRRFHIIQLCWIKYIIKQINFYIFCYIYINNLECLEMREEPKIYFSDDMVKRNLVRRSLVTIKSKTATRIC